MQLIIGPLAKRLRLEQGLKQGAVAKAIGTTGGNLCRFELGQQGLSLPLLAKLTTLLGTNVNTLLNIETASTEIQDIALSMADFDDTQLAGIKGFIAAMNLKQTKEL